MKFKIALLSMALLCTACQTSTGDPRAGGFWGWSAEKAQQRQQQLQNDADNAQQQAANTGQQTALLTEQRRAEQLEVRMVELQLGALLTENETAERELDDLRKRKLKESTRLTSLLKELDARKTEVAAQARALLKSKDESKQRVSLDERKRLTRQLDADNAKLRQAILLYLQR